MPEQKDCGPTWGGLDLRKGAPEGPEETASGEPTWLAVILYPEPGRLESRVLLAPGADPAPPSNPILRRGASLSHPQEGQLPQGAKPHRCGLQEPHNPGPTVTGRTPVPGLSQLLPRWLFSVTGNARYT